jgi:hypothetical protein
MAATVAATLLRDAARAVPESGHLSALSHRWDEQRVPLIRLITPADYQVLSRNIEAASPTDPVLVVVLDGLTTLFWSEHQAFILAPLVKYVRRDNLSDKANRIIRELNEPRG